MSRIALLLVPLVLTSLASAGNHPGVRPRIASALRCNATLSAEDRTDVPADFPTEVDVTISLFHGGIELEGGNYDSRARLTITRNEYDANGAPHSIAVHSKAEFSYFTQTKCVHATYCGAVYHNDQRLLLSSAIHAADRAFIRMQTRDAAQAVASGVLILSSNGLDPYVHARFDLVCALIP